MLKRFIRYFISRIQMVKVFRESDKYLQNGRYFIHNSLTYICINDKGILKKANDMFKTDLGILLYNTKSGYFKKQAMLIIKLLLSSRLKVSGNKKDEKEFLGSVFLISGNGKDYKIFDFTNKKVLWKFSCEEDFVKKINYYRFFSGYFSMPEQYEYNIHERTIMEEYIEFIPYNYWTEKDLSHVINQAFNKYICYFQACKQLQDYKYTTINCYLKNILDRQSILEYVVNNIHSFLINARIPVLKMHGDLWTSNMLLSGEPDYDVFYIDWEHLNELVFFYDLFFIMWNEAFLRDNYYYINQYVQGEYDNYLVQIFSIFDLQYNEAFKADYFSIFFIVKYKERWERESYTIQEAVLKQYKKTVSMMRGIVSEE